MVVELSYDKARKKYKLNTVDCSTTAELEPHQQIIGQERAVKALQFGLKMKKLRGSFRKPSKAKTMPRKGSVQSRNLKMRRRNSGRRSTRRRMRQASCSRGVPSG
jgi:hypothetical protein